MTQECEERLISDVSEVKALLLAHTKQHDEKKSLTPVWFGIAISTALGVLGIFGVGKP
jgi:hypothetical protein